MRKHSIHSKPNGEDPSFSIVVLPSVGNSLPHLQLREPLSLWNLRLKQSAYWKQLLFITKDINIWDSGPNLKSRESNRGSRMLMSWEFSIIWLHASRKKHSIAWRSIHNTLSMSTRWRNNSLYVSSAAGLKSGERSIWTKATIITFARSKEVWLNLKRDHLVLPSRKRNQPRDLNLPQCFWSKMWLQNRNPPVLIRGVTAKVESWDASKMCSRTFRLFSNDDYIEICIKYRLY